MRPLTMDECSFMPDAEVRWIKRRRRDGSSYSARVVVGTKCGAHARFSRNGVHRCMAHLGER